MAVLFSYQDEKVGDSITPPIHGCLLRFFNTATKKPRRGGACSADQ